MGGGNLSAVRVERRRRYRTVAYVMAVTVAIDVLVLSLVVPWAEEKFYNPIMSVGYIITFLVVFSNLVTVFTLVAYLFHGDSYPSDRWR